MAGDDSSIATTESPEGKESNEEVNDASMATFRENDKEQNDQDVQRIGCITTRGFSGSPKFSDFRRTMTSSNTSTASNSCIYMEGNKDSKSDAKVKEGNLPVDRLKNYGVDMSAVDEEMDQIGILEKISEQLSFVKQEIKEQTKVFVHEVKDLCGKAVKGGYDP